jgi:hypothetical protein
MARHVIYEIHVTYGRALYPDGADAQARHAGLWPLSMTGNVTYAEVSI